MALAAALDFFPADRWSTATVAAAASLEPACVASLTPMAWAKLLDEIEAALACVFADACVENDAARASSH